MPANESKAQLKLVGPKKPPYTCDTLQHRRDAVYIADLLLLEIHFLMTHAKHASMNPDRDPVRLNAETLSLTLRLSSGGEDLWAHAHETDGAYLKYKEIADGWLLEKASVIQRRRHAVVFLKGLVKVLRRWINEQWPHIEATREEKKSVWLDGLKELLVFPISPDNFDTKDLFLHRLCTMIENLIEITPVPANGSSNLQPEEIKAETDDLARSNENRSNSIDLARAAYDWATSDDGILHARNMTYDELYEALRTHSRYGPEALPPCSTTFGRYLRKSGLKRYSKRAAPHVTGSVRAQSELGGSR